MQFDRGMFRAMLVVLAMSLVLVWIVAVVDHSTVWLTWLDGAAALLGFLSVFVARDDVGPIGIALAPGLIGAGLIALFVVGLATRASAWLAWFTFALGVGYLGYAGMALLVRAFEPRLESRRPLTRL